MGPIPRTLLFGLLQMVQRHLGVRGRDIGMALLAVIESFLEMFNSFFGMWIGLYLLPSFGVSDENTCMAPLAVIDCFFGVADGFRDMVFGGQRNLRRQKQGKSEAQHGG